MLPQLPLLVILVMLLERIPISAPPKKHSPGRPKVYQDGLMAKALIIMVIHCLYTAYSLLAFLELETPLTQELSGLLTDEKGRFTSQLTWERRHSVSPDELAGLIGVLRGYLERLIKPGAKQGRAAALDSTALWANGGVRHKKHREAGVFCYQVFGDRVMMVTCDRVFLAAGDLFWLLRGQFQQPLDSFEEPIVLHEVRIAHYLRVVVLHLRERKGICIR